MQYPEIYELFCIKSPESQGLLLLKIDTFEQFINFLPPSLLIEFKEYKALIPPRNIDSTEMKIWISNAIKRLGIKQNKFCEEVKIDPSTFSRFLKGTRGLDLDQVSIVVSNLKTKLISARLLKP